MNKTQYWLSKLAEEAAEISQDALKAQQFGLDEVYPKTGETNLERLRKEIVDMIVIIDIIEKDTGAALHPNSWGGVPQFEHSVQKYDKVSYYLRHAISLGQVVEEKPPQFREGDPVEDAQKFLAKREAH